MRRSFLGRVIPATLTGVGVAVSSATAAIVMLHAILSGSGTQSASPAQSSGTSAAAAATPTTPASTATPRIPATTATPQPATGATATVVGPVINDQFGQVQATITVAGTKITNVSITAPESDPRSSFINQQAVPLLQSETLQAQSGNVNLISGATVTSEAYIQSLQGALQTVGL